MKEWHLKKGADQRIRTGHPWVFAHELENSPTDLTPGSPVRLLDAKGNFVATGYGNHHSKIVFRALSWKKDEDVFTQDVLVSRIQSAILRRLEMGFFHSCRLVFSESDDLPGLILDRYLTDENQQVLSFQILTAGMNRWMSQPLKILEQVVQGLSELPWMQSVSSDASKENLKAFIPSFLSWEKTVVISRCDVSVRKLEGLSIDEPQVLRGSGDFRKVTVKVEDQSSEKSEFLLLTADLIEGQKTGFFMDQTKNMKLAIDLIQKRTWGRQVRILDLCSYVGHWSLQLGNAFRKMGVQPQLVCADVSKEALAFAEANLKSAGLACESALVDVLKETDRWPEGPFDVVIVDPPAFVKNRKDLPTGEHAYMKLNSEAFKRVKPGALVVSCSCSGLVDQSLFEGALSKALRRSGRRGVWAVQGGQGEDHPVLPWFPDGRYLKMVVTEISVAGNLGT